MNSMHARTTLMKPREMSHNLCFLEALMSFRSDWSWCNSIDLISMALISAAIFWIEIGPSFFFGLVFGVDRCLREKGHCLAWPSSPSSACKCSWSSDTSGLGKDSFFLVSAKVESEFLESPCSRNSLSWNSLRPRTSVVAESADSIERGGLLQELLWYEDEGEHALEHVIAMFWRERDSIRRNWWPSFKSNLARAPWSSSGRCRAQTQIPSRSKRAAKKRSNLLDQFQDFFGSIL